MNMKKIATMATCMALVGAVAVGGTLALVTRNDSITNTFVVGKGFPDDTPDQPFFYVDEAAVEMDITGNWVADGEQPRMKDGQTYGSTAGHENWKVVGNSTLAKDPTFHLDGTLLQEGESAPTAYVVAYIGWDKDVTDDEKDFYEIYNTSESSKWYKIEPNGSATQVTKETEMEEGYYLFIDELTATKGNVVHTNALFNEVKVGNDVPENDDLKLSVYGVAVEKAPDMVTLKADNLDQNTDQVKALYATAKTVVEDQQ